MGRPIVDIAMYHSVSDRGGATSIAPSVFASQMQAIADIGIEVITLDELVAARQGQRILARRSIILTFDDGFQDFAEIAWPQMRRYEFRPIVYLPTSFVGGVEGWHGIASPPRPLMGWDTVRALAAEGVMFGSHTETHPDLDSLGEGDLKRELTTSKEVIEARLGRPVRHFAPPYGIAGRHVRDEIARLYDTSVGTRLDRATAAGDLYDLPRIEMFYFTETDRWRAHLEGRGGSYLTTRRALRAVKGAVMKPWRGVSA